MDINGIQISFEKVLLSLVILTIWAGVLIMEKFMPHQSAAIILLCIIALYGVLISMATFHHRRKLAKGDVPYIDCSHYKPLVSIIVPAHNEAAVIEETVRNLLTLDYENYELWVFDDRSTDGTGEILASLEGKVSDKYRYFIRPQTATPGKSAVLNDALERSRGEILLIFDADARVDSDFIQKALPYLCPPETGAVQARKVIMNADCNLLTRCQYNEYLLDAYFQAGRDVIRGAVELRGNGQFVKREALYSVDGWTEDTITDDLDLATKLHLAGWDIRYLNDVQVREEGIIHFKPLLRQRRRWAEGSLKRYLEHGFDMLTSPHASHRSTMDMLAYFIEFIFPLWVAADISLQLLNMVLKDWPSHWMSSLVALPALGIFFLSGLVLALRNYDRTPWPKAILWAIETAIFLLIVWVPVVMWITAKILMTKDEGPLNWGKTEHLGTQIHVKPSQFARFKKLLQKPGS